MGFGSWTEYHLCFKIIAVEVMKMREKAAKASSRRACVNRKKNCTIAVEMWMWHWEFFLNIKIIVSS